MWNPSRTREVYKDDRSLVRSRTISNAFKIDTLEAIVSSESIIRAPKPPKKRFLEAAAAFQLQQQQQQQQMENNRDGSSLMQFAEMCIYYQKGGADCSIRSPWSPSHVWDAVDRSTMNTDPLVYSINNNMTKVSSPPGDSPKAATPYWGWANAPGSAVQEENDEPLDLSGEETIRTNQQELIDHLVEKLCALPDKKPRAGPIQPRKSTTDPASSSEVSSTVDVKEAAINFKADVRRDLPLKKRDPFSIQQIRSPQVAVVCDSSADVLPRGSPAAEPVSSTNTRPAPRSCKGKRYLEFMYEGRIPLGSRVKRMESQQQLEMACQSSTSLGVKKRRRPSKKPLEPTTLSLRERKSRKFS